jgi:hypothetical protein
MLRKLGPKLPASLTVLIVAIRAVSGYLNFRARKNNLEVTTIPGADRSIELC